MNILVVDDNELFIFSISKTLTDLGLPHKVCANGLEAKRLLEKEHFDVIITDIVMPELDGLELLKYIRENRSYQNLYVVATSAGSRVISKRIALSSANILANATLSKPFTKQELIHCVAKAREYLDAA